MEIGSLVK